MTRASLSGIAAVSPPILILAVTLGCACPAADTQAASPLPAIAFSVDGIRLIQDDRPLPQSLVQLAGGNLEIARHLTDPWGAWRSGLHVRLSIAPPDGWALVQADQATGAARLDSGEVLACEPATSPPFPRDNEGQRRSDDDVWPATNRNDPRCAVGLQFPLPVRSCSGIASLRVAVRVVIAELAQTKRIHLAPKANQAQAVPGGDLVITLTGQGEVRATFTSGTVARYRQVHFLSADGKELVPNNRNSHGGDHGMIETFGCRQPVAAVDIDCFGQMRCATVECVFTGLAFAANDPRALTRQSSGSQEMPLPPLGPGAAGASAPAPAPATARKAAGANSNF